MVEIAGRSYVPRVYGDLRKADVHAFLLDAVARSGGIVLHASPDDRAPVHLGVQTATGDRLGMMIYPFQMTQRLTANRPADEVRGQFRYGGEAKWEGEHPIAFDPAGVDVTVLLGVHIEGDVLVGLQPALYDPLPMGISFYAKTAQLNLGPAGWSVWEHETHAGSRRSEARAEGLETMIGFRPDRLLDYALFEQRATGLGLDQPLRFSAADSARQHGGISSGAGDRMHELERQFDLTSHEIVEIIAGRSQLEVAVRGGVAEHHLERLLRADSHVRDVVRLDASGQHDFDVVMVDGRKVSVECKNASPRRYASGDFRVEVQKTRVSKGDPASRYYRADQFDVLAACLYSPTGSWTFRFQATRLLATHGGFPDRLTPMQPVTDDWPEQLSLAVARLG